MRIAIIGMLLMLPASTALAQLGNPAGMAPGTADQPARAGEIANTTDQLFVRLAGAGGSAEVDLAMLASQHATDDGVKTFARAMSDDHSKANLQLSVAAKRADLEVPKEPDAEHKAIRTRLEKLPDHRFDLDYIDGQVQDHLKTVQLLEWEINSGQDADIQHFASETLPIVLGHLKMAQELQVQLHSMARR